MENNSFIKKLASKFTKKQSTEIKENHPPKGFDIRCSGISHYYVKVRKQDSDISYRLAAEILIHTATLSTFPQRNKPQTEILSSNYQLQRIYWGNGGYICFIERALKGYKSPLLFFDVEVEVTSDKNEIYYVTLTRDTVEDHLIEMDKLKHFKRTLYNDINKLLDKTVNQHKYFSELIADYRKLFYFRVAEELKTKKRPALKASEQVSALSKKLHTIEKKYLVLKYQLDAYSKVFPWITEFEQITLDDIETLTHTAQDTSSERSYLSTYLSPKEYNSLSRTEKYQLALDRYKQKPKSNWQIGIEFERYIGYLYESKGYKVTYYGAKKGLEDLGRDLIAYKGSKIVVIQCKYWKKEKTIHEKHIFQLFGTMFALNIEQHKGNDKLTFEDEALKFDDVSGVFITTASLSDTARLYAEKLNIQVQENIDYDKDYPCIKCNISKTGEKIYHLPFDQQYDNIVINTQKGECYAHTIQEAEELGFRHALKWTNKNIP